MKKLRSSALTLASLALLASNARADFHDHVGLQMWSLRATTLAKGLPASLDVVKGFGLTEVETGGSTGSLSPEQIRAALDERGLKAVSSHVNYEQMTKDLTAVIKGVKTMGAKYAFCPWIPHQGVFDAATAQRAAEDFNKWGEAFRAEGIRFGYHPHGYELVPTATAGETLLDDLIRATRPDAVCLEMDVFWIFHGGGDPVKLLEKYSSRWVALHVKDIRKGAPTGKPTGKAPDTDNVAVGSGQLDWKAIIGTAQKHGASLFFIEDETPAPLENIPVSQAYLKALKL